MQFFRLDMYVHVDLRRNKRDDDWVKDMSFDLDCQLDFFIIYLIKLHIFWFIKLLKIDTG